MFTSAVRYSEFRHRITPVTTAWVDQPVTRTGLLWKHTIIDVSLAHSVLGKNLLGQLNIHCYSGRGL